ncbi:siphovirus ReqiPepy6 Gp37-like family protein [Streptomyces sp. NPDC059874]|uniref:siphovirus ReqiPepy6 Gp37-like family protein n=1 Tax=Streptomyces sp. NPDC059874 TaxID=3346983 RepID=UPI00364B0E5A
MGYRVEVFDKNMKRVGEIDQWISLDFTVRFSQEGSWQILIKDGTPQSDMIEKGGGVVIWQDGVADPVLSGQVDVYQKYWTKVQHTGPGSLYIGGKCHNQLAYSRLAFPSPTIPVPQQWQGWNTRGAAGAASLAMWWELEHALGSSALTDRRMPHVNTGSNPDPEIGQEVSDTLRYDVIGTKLEEWCKPKSIGYRFIYNPTYQRVDLKLYKPRDRSKSIRFSTDLGNLREYIYTLNAPKVTRVIVACQGQGKERYISQKIDTATEAEWGRSIEGFVDRRDVPLKTGPDGSPVLVTTTGGDGIEDIGQKPDGSDWTSLVTTRKTELAAAQQAYADADTDAERTAAAATVTTATNNLKAALTAAKPTAVAYYLKVVSDAADAALRDGEKSGNFQVYPIDTADCQFGRDYFVGDLVTVVVDGTEYTDLVREVVISVDDGGNAQDVNPKIGQQGSGDPLNLYRTVYDMQKKLRRLEARM